MPETWFIFNAVLVVWCFSWIVDTETTSNLHSDNDRPLTHDITPPSNDTIHYWDGGETGQIPDCFPECRVTNSANVAQNQILDASLAQAPKFPNYLNTSHVHIRNTRAALRFETDADPTNRPVSIYSSRSSRSSARQSRLTADWDAQKLESPDQVQQFGGAAIADRYPDEEARYLSPQAIATLSETLGAINTVGRYLVNYTRADKGSSIQHIKAPTQVAKPSEELPNAIYTISKNVLGRNMTDTIAPIVRGVAPLVTLSSGKVVVQENANGNGEGGASVNRPCTTPDGLTGNCQDLSNCPQLLLNLNHLRQSICFKSLFVPGVCCPTKVNQAFLTERPPTVIEQHKPHPTISSTTKKPTISSSPSNIGQPVVSVVPLYTTESSASISSVFQAEDCGQPEVPKFRVVGGDEALPGRWPWMAAIFLHGPRRTEFWCGGSLIGPRHILTAAHCTRDNRQRPARQFTVRLGDIDLRRDDEPSAPETYGVTEVRAHPRFSRVGFYNDIAVLVLDRNVRRSRYVLPVCLPTVSLKDESFTGRNPTVVGWGTTYYGGKESTVQRQAELPIWNNAECDKTYFQPITENFLCAGLKEGGKDACQGDSGGPLLLKQGSYWMQVGIVSFGNKCGEPGYPGVYTRVSKYLDWLKDNVT